MRYIIVTLFAIVVISCTSKNDNDIVPSNINTTDDFYLVETAKLNLRIDQLTIDSNDNILVATINGWLYRSTDAGANWTKLNNNLVNILFSISSIAIDSKGTIYVASQQIYKSINEGQSFTEISKDGIRADNLYIGKNDELLAYGNTNYGVLRSTNNGYTWIKADTIVRDFSPTKIISNKTGLMYAANNYNLLRSADNGKSWSNIKSELIYDIAVNNENELYVVAGSALERVLYKTKDGGKNWERLGSTKIEKLLINSNGILYGAKGIEGIQRSSDGGKTWIDLSNGLLQKIIRAIAFDNKGFLYVGTGTIDSKGQMNNGEVYRSNKSTLN